jgi:hypothetical protein
MEKSKETKEQKNDLNNLNLAMITRKEEIRKATTATSTKNKNENICNNATIMTESILFKSSIVQSQSMLFGFKKSPENILLTPYA